MSGLQAQVDDYLLARRALGYRLERQEQWLRQLVEYLHEAGSVTLTSELMISWARLPATAQPRHWAQRLGCARKFGLSCWFRGSIHAAWRPGRGGQ